MAKTSVSIVLAESAYEEINMKKIAMVGAGCLLVVQFTVFLYL